MARSRSSFKRFNRPAIQSYWVEFPFFLFGLGKFRRALKHGYQRMGFGVRGFYWGKKSLRTALDLRNNLAAEARFPYLPPLWTVSTTFKYNYPAEELLPTKSKTLVLPALSPAVGLLPYKTTLYLSPDAKWIELDEEIYFLTLIYESQTSVSMAVVTDFDLLRQSLYYLCFKLTF